MDNETLTRWKTLANDAVIATFGEQTREQQLAEALEQAVEALDDSSNNCETCSICSEHGNKDDDRIGDVDVDAVLGVHRALKDDFKDLNEFAEGLDDDDRTALLDKLNDLQSNIDELEATVIP